MHLNGALRDGPEEMRTWRRRELSAMAKVVTWLPSVRGRASPRNKRQVSSSLPKGRAEPTWRWFRRNTFRPRRKKFPEMRTNQQRVQLPYSGDRHASWTLSGDSVRILSEMGTEMTELSEYDHRWLCQHWNSMVPTGGDLETVEPRAWGQVMIRDSQVEGMWGERNSRSNQKEQASPWAWRAEGKQLVEGKSWCRIWTSSIQGLLRIYSWFYR